MINIGMAVRFTQRPAWFFLCLAPLFAVFMYVGGFSLSLGVAVYFVFLLWYTLARNGQVDTFYLYAITFLLLFDSSAFVFTPLKLRLWYPLLVLYFGRLSFKRLVLGKASPIIASPMGWVVFGYYLAASLVWLVVDDDAGRLANAKYFFFSVGLLLFYRQQLKAGSREMVIGFLRYLATLCIFVAGWGMIQFIANHASEDLGRRLQLDYLNIRPSGFFSETTWYAEFCLLGVFLVALLVNLRAVRGSWVLFLAPLLVGIFISSTRNAILGLSGGIVVLGLLSVVRNRWRKPPLLNIWFLVLAIAGIVACALMWGRIVEQAAHIVERFNISDVSALSRLDAFDTSIQEIKDVFWTGGGYTWQADQSTDAGTFTGSKSFNLFLMIGYIFGGMGLLVLLIGMFWFCCRAFARFWPQGDLLPKYALVLFLVFTIMAMFSPMHQYPFGLMVFGLSTALHSVRPSHTTGELHA